MSVGPHLSSAEFCSYENILTRLRSRGDEFQQSRAERILGWLAFAYRSLKVWEICDGLVFHESKTLNEETKLGGGVLDICKPLIEQRDDETVALVHFSAREYGPKGINMFVEADLPVRFLLHKMSGPYISPFRVHADITMACLRFLLTCSPLVPPVISGASHDHIIKGAFDLFPYVHEFWPDHLLNYSKTLLGHPGEQKRIDAVQDLLCMISSQTFSAPKVLTPSPGGAVVEDNSVDSESSVLGDFPLAVRHYIAHRKKTPAKQTSLANGTISSSDLSQTDLGWIPAAYRTFQTHFESLITAANSLDYHQMRAQYRQMTATSDNVHKFKIRHSKSAFLCRWSDCIWASAGFQSISEREKHEIIMHIQRFRCSDPNCEFAQNGFSSRHALKQHALKYHTRTEDLVLPAFAIPKSRLEKPLEDSNVRPHVEGQNELKTSQVSRFLRGSLNEDELFDRNTFSSRSSDEDTLGDSVLRRYMQTADDNDFEPNAFNYKSHGTQIKARSSDSSTNTHTQGQAKGETLLSKPYAKPVPPEPATDQTLHVPPRGNRDLREHQYRVRLWTFLSS